MLGQLRPVSAHRKRRIPLLRSGRHDLDASHARWRRETDRSYGVLKSGLASSSGDADSGCSAFQRMAAVIRVRPLG